MLRFLAVFMLLAGSSAVVAQQVATIPSNRFAVTVGYSNDSSHIIMGRADNRRFSYVGLQYERVSLSRGWGVVAYQAEWRPVVVNIDPEEYDVATVESPTLAPQTYSYTSRPGVCRAATVTYPVVTDIPTTVMYVTTCGHTATFGQGLTPVGFRINMMPHRRWQPVASASAGILLSTRAIPVEQSGSFNFLFDFGVGVERVADNGRAWRLEYLIQHYSNKDTADVNPGVDNGVFKVSYVFGR